MQRLEILTGRERRRRWSPEEKARLVAEAFAPGSIVFHVARRHGVAESCLYAWRKQLTQSSLERGRNEASVPRLIPVSAPCRWRAQSCRSQPRTPRLRDGRS